MQDVIIILTILEFSMIYYDIVARIMKLFRVYVAYHNNYDSFQHFTFIFSQKIKNKNSFHYFEDYLMTEN
jgi:hypothetical protein